MAFLWTRTSPDQADAAEHIRITAETLGLALSLAEVSEASDVEKAFETVLRERAEALLVQNISPVTGRVAAQVAELAMRHRLPAAGGLRAFAVAGGLMTYGVSVAGQFRRAAYFVDRILRGAKPADLPVEQPMTFECVVNLKTAQALGLTIPCHVMLQSTEVIE